MKRLLVLAVVLGCASWLAAQEGRVWLPRPFELPPFNRTQTTLLGVAGRPSRAVAVGNGRSPLAIYVYDRLGQCVAHDDDPSGPIDDRVAAWVPAESGPFDVQIRNVGPVFIRVEASAK
jgi:hypothetical protein